MVWFSSEGNIADQSIDRLKGRIREITRRNRGVSFETIIAEINLVIIGWTNYYRLANVWLANLRDIDGWLRRIGNYDVIALNNVVGVTPFISFFVVVTSQSVKAGTLLCTHRVGGKCLTGLLLDKR